MAALLSAAGGQFGWLTRRGAVAATALGTAILWQAGWGGGILLGTFFLSGSLLSYGRPAIRSTTGRTWRQVVANGGVAAIGALVIPWSPVAGWALLAGALAAAQADTWGTEIGRHARNSPRLLVGGQTVPPGTSGGVTWLGSAAGLAGALLMGLLTLAASAHARVAVWSLVGGICGTLVDSAVGATLQARFRCPSCGAEFERPTHHCSGPAQLARGLGWIGNDTVNGLATAVGGGVTAVGALLTS